MFFKKNINSIPLEETAHATGSRKMLVSKGEVVSDAFEALTFGYLPADKEWILHKHENIEEICLVISGIGVIKDKEGNKEAFQMGDRFIFPPNTEHAIENTGQETAEFYFIRIKSKNTL